jgi:flavodoxin I
MKKIGLFYSPDTVKTRQVGERIIKALGDAGVSAVSVKDATQEDFEKYDNIIAGASTWFDGELPVYWDEVLPEIESANLKNKKVAIFGLGDQVGYPDNFADGVGLLADIFIKAGAVMVGSTSTEGYKFEHSQAVKDGRFIGLVIDVENQSKLTDERIKSWVNQLKKEFD